MLSFSEGYKTYVNLMGANQAVMLGGAYVENVENAINELEDAVNSLKFNKDGSINNIDLDALKGFAAEKWHAGVFNVDAAVKGSNVRANAENDNGLADIVFGDGNEAQLKYYENAKASAKEQAKTIREKYEQYRARYRYEHNGQNPDKTLETYIEEYNSKHGKNATANDPYYSGQVRVIPAEQVDEAKRILERKISEMKFRDPELAKRYQDALDNLSDKIEVDGVESYPLTEEQSREIAKALRDEGFDPADFGITTEELITTQYIMEQAFKAGLSAALMSVVFKVAPEICNIICKLIKDGEVDIQDFKRMGFAALSGGAEGYIRGTIAAAITISCKAGHLGSVLKAADPTIIGAIVALTMNTVKNACLIGIGKMSKHEFAGRCAQDLIVSTCCLAMGYAGSALATTLFTPAAAVIGYMIGSFVGSVIGSFVYKGVYSCVMSYCVESGSTFFGLVDQDYTLPDDILRAIGIKLFEYEKFIPKQITIKRFEPKRFTPMQLKPQEISVTVLRRGVIGVGSVGYV